MTNTVPLETVRRKVGSWVTTRSLDIDWEVVSVSCQEAGMLTLVLNKGSTALLIDSEGMW